MVRLLPWDGTGLVFASLALVPAGPAGYSQGRPWIREEGACP
jgi:hypothetical protein